VRAALRGREASLGVPGREGQAGRGVRVAGSGLAVLAVEGVGAGVVVSVGPGVVGGWGEWSKPHRLLCRPALF